MIQLDNNQLELANWLYELSSGGSQYGDHTSQAYK